MSFSRVCSVMTFIAGGGAIGSKIFIFGRGFSILRFLSAGLWSFIMYWLMSFGYRLLRAILSASVDDELIDWECMCLPPTSDYRFGTCFFLYACASATSRPRVLSLTMFRSMEELTELLFNALWLWWLSCDWLLNTFTWLEEKFYLSWGNWLFDGLLLRWLPPAFLTPWSFR